MQKLFVLNMDNRDTLCVCYYIKKTTNTIIKYVIWIVLCETYHTIYYIYTYIIQTVRYTKNFTRRKKYKKSKKTC